MRVLHLRYIIQLIILCGLISLCYGQTGEDPNNSPIHVLSTIEKYPQTIKNNDPFDQEMVKDLKLLLPCEDIHVPKRGTRLPNAPRDYRSGTHRGIDFFANWGTPVRAVADGSVIRADHHYLEVPAGFRSGLLSASSRVGHTPSDIFNSVLLGKAIFLDHGFDLIPGFRTITIYAHLSSINKDVIPGSTIKAGHMIGQSGNTGTRESTLGTKNDAHLHWEMILQKGNKEIYLGKDMPYEQLYTMLDNIFIKSDSSKIQ